MNRSLYSYDETVRSQQSALRQCALDAIMDAMRVMTLPEQIEVINKLDVENEDTPKVVIVYPGYAWEIVMTNGGKWVLFDVEGGMPQMMKLSANSSVKQATFRL